jgi:hypothetical protein
VKVWFCAALALVLTLASEAEAQNPSRCRILCTPEFKVEPTVTIGGLFGSPRIVDADGTIRREPRSTDIEMIFSFEIPTRIPWLEFTLEGIVLPFDHDSTPELEFETNFIWLPAERTGGWISSHFDVVEKFSPAERAEDTRAYTHKLNLELDTSVSIFNWLRPGRWIRGVEIEGSLDYVATGLPKAGEVVDGRRFLGSASPWSFSFVLVLPIAPM